MIKLTFLIPLILLLTSCSNQSEPGETEDLNQEIVTAATDTVSLIEIASVDDLEFLEFGFCNEAGTKVLMLKPPDSVKAANFNTVIDPSGKLVPLTYKSYKAPSKNDNYRQTPYNFNESGGHSYDVKGKLDAWNTVLMITDEFLLNRKIARSQPDTGVEMFSEEERKFIEKKYGRKIKKEQDAGGYDNGARMRWLEFEPKNDSLLVSIYFKLADGQKLFLDFPAVDDEISSWRVDDGGQFDFGSIRILAVFDGPEGLEFINDWMGAEGSSTSYWKQKDNSFAEKKSAYRYMAPM